MSEVSQPGFTFEVCEVVDGERGDLLGGAGTADGAVQIACAYYTTLQLLVPESGRQIGVFGPSGDADALIGKVLDGE